MTLATFAFAQQDNVSTCYETYKGQITKGYNALAMAIDNGFSVCGYAFGHFDKQRAFKQSIAECENKRLDPANEVDGVRKIMTHCRIYQFKFVEE
jgi:hypothetical protein